MNGLSDDFQNDFNNNLNAVVNNNNSIYLDAWLEKYTDLSNKEVWAVKVLMSSSNFSFNKTIVIGGSPASKKKAQSIVKSIKDWYDGFSNLKEAFEITSRCYLEGDNNDIDEPWQRDCVDRAVKFVGSFK